MLSLKLSFKNFNNLFKTLSKVFIGISVILALFIIGKYLMIQQLSTPTFNTPDLTQDTKEIILPISLSFSNYTDDISTEKIFKKTEIKQAIPQTISTPDIKTIDLQKSYKILGIMLTNTPKVLVQNLTDGQSSVLSIGDKINDMRLKTILKDKIIFDSNGEDLILSL